MWSKSMCDNKRGTYAKVVASVPAIALIELNTGHGSPILDVAAEG
jgi:hypothetical protein